MRPLVFCLQMCPYDALAAVELCALIADLQGGTRQDLEFWVVYRRDTPKEYIHWANDHLSRVFRRVFFFEAPNFADGFPMGCNLLWNSTMLIAGSARVAGLNQATGILTFEPDCVPVTRNWMDALCDEWEADDSPVVGNFVGEPPNQHVNGNAMFDVNLMRQYPELGSYGGEQAWDTCHGRLLTRIGRDTNLITQKYQARTITREELFSIRKNGMQPALFHGVKDGSARAAVRAEFGL